MTTTLEILQKARATIALPENWTQGAYARNKQGAACSALNKTARCWCASGALHKAWQGNYSVLYVDALNILGRVAGMSIIDYNDRHTHEELLAVFDKAIEIAENSSCNIPSA